MEIPRSSSAPATVAPARTGRRDRERGARRQAMLDAAIAVFAEKGFAEATMDEIAERAEFGKGTLYNYFEDKQALLAAAFEEAYDGLVALVDQYFEEELGAGTAGPRATRAVFHGFIAHLTAYFQTHHAVFVVMMKEAHRLAFDGNGGHVATLLLRQRDRVAAAIEVPLEAAMQRGDLRTLPTRPVAQLIMGNVQGYLMNVACTSGFQPGADMPAQTADFITTVLFDGLLAETT
jgi:TetR/AcrR family transcriptional regulator, repressor of fatR-cypB operon